MVDSEGTSGKNQVTALVVEGEAAARAVLVSVLERRGYRVQACETLAEGRNRFGHQPLIVTHANGSVGELRGFVEFVRQRSGDSQPYILAVGTPDSPSVTNAAQLGLNDVLPMPLDRDKLDLRIAAISHWLSRRGFALGAIPLSPPSSPSPAPAMTAPPPPRSPYPRAETAPVPPPIPAWTDRLLDCIPQAVALFDRSMRYRAVNRAYLTAFGLDRDSILGRSHYEIFTQLHPSWKDLFDRALMGEPGVIELDVFERADGSRDYVRWEVKPWPAGANPPEGAVLSQEIVTERVRAERRHQVERRIAASLVESATLPMVAVAPDGRILRTSPAARSWLGLQPTADGRQFWWTVYPDADEEAEKQRFLAAAPGNNGKAPAPYTPSPIRVSGADHRLLHWTATVQIGANGNAEGWLFAGALVEPAPPAAAPVSLPAASPLRGSPQDLLDHLPFAVIRLNGTGDVILANEPSTALLGHAFDGQGVEGWLEKGCPDPSFRGQVIREWRECVWRRQMTKVFSLMTAEGLLKEIEFRPRLLSDGDLLLTLVDVTETRRSEDALRSSEVKFRALYQETPTGIALTDRSGSVVDANPAFEKMVGRSRLELRRGTLAQLVHPDDAAALVGELSTLAGGERSVEPVGLRLVDRTGGEATIQLTSSQVRNAAGESVLTAYYALPVSAPAPAWEDNGAFADAEGVWGGAARPSGPEAAGAESVADAAFRGLPTPLIVTDLRGRIVELNNAAERLFGYRSVELTGAGLYRLFQPDQPAAFRKSVSDQINSRRHWQADTTYVKPSGTTGRCRAEIHPALGPGKSGLLICSVQVSAETEPPRSGDPPRIDANAPTRTVTLSRPVRHALRNHLQLVGSLLHLQQRRVGDPTARAQLAATHERVRAIALVEEQILTGADPQALDMSHLMRALVDQRRSLLPASHHAPGAKILFGPTPLDTGLALPLVLIANELLQIAIGPEPQAQPAEINLSWEEGVGLLTFRWIGDPNDLDSADGLEVARLLAEQIGGHLMFSDDGAAIQAEVHFHYAQA